MLEENQTYFDKETQLQAFVVTKDPKVKRPCVLIFHSWHGRDDFFCGKAKLLAELGYVGIAVDMYGGAKLGGSQEENAALMAPFIEDRELLKRRAIAAFEFAKTLSFVDCEKIAAIGFCFGGMCALDLARADLPLKAAVSFHGLLDAPGAPFAKKVSAKVLAMTGFDDPWVLPEQTLNFEKEMTSLQADWQYVSFGHTKHAYTNPICTDNEGPNRYNPVAAKRAWLMMQNLFSEVFNLR